MKVDFKEIKLVDIEENPILDFHKVLARVIFMHTQNLDLVEVARQVNKGEPVEIRDSDWDEITRCTKCKESGLSAFAKKAIVDFVEEQKRKEDAENS
jgi:hypothetical protein